jgi:hypothetical protein
LASNPVESHGRPHIEHHRAVEYRVADLGLMREGFTVTPSADGSRIDVAGTCPGCGARVTSSWEYGIPGYKGVFPRREKSGRVEAEREKRDRTIVCACGHVHANRPAESWDLGCGACWQVEVP